MIENVPVFPPQASTTAALVDHLYFFLVGMSLFGSLLVAGLLIVFAFKYRKTARADRSNPVSEHTSLEIFWTIVPLGLFLFVFYWAASIYFHISRPPDDAMQVQVVGKRWMWKLQHLNGRREINELHIPVGRPVKLTMTSEDVIHSFFVPAFRVKQDVLPGRYTTVWFEATKPGRYHLFCAEYCGTKHSQMIGSIIVMEPTEFQAWLTGEQRGVSLASAGEKLFTRLGCVTCHNATSRARGPNLEGLYGTNVKLADGSEILMDEAYIRESIVTPNTRKASGYEVQMPTFQGLVSEEGILQLIEYIKSIGPEADGGQAPPPAESAAGPAVEPSGGEPRS